MAREFYPMITNTVKTLIKIASPNDLTGMLFVLREYPAIKKLSPIAKTPTIEALLDELDRQYARWNKGE